MLGGAVGSFFFAQVVWCELVGCDFGFVLKIRCVGGIFVRFWGPARGPGDRFLGLFLAWSEGGTAGRDLEACEGKGDKDIFGLGTALCFGAGFLKLF